MNLCLCTKFSMVNGSMEALVYLKNTKKFDNGMTLVKRSNVLRYIALGTIIF